MSGRGRSGGSELTRLVQQIGEILAQGEQSGSQSQASDGGLKARLRSVLLNLLDTVIGNPAVGNPGTRALLR